MQTLPLPDLSAEALTEMRARQAHLYARIGPPGARAKDEDAAFDLETGRFVVRWGGRPVSALSAVILGSSGDGLYTPAAGDPSLPVEARGALGRALGGRREYGPLLGEDPLRASDLEAEVYARWLVLGLGALGPYPWECDGGVRWLALRSVGHPEPSSTPAPWCTYCGRSDVRRLIGGDPCAICDGDRCLGLFREVLAAAEAEGGTETPDAPAGQGCGLCFGHRQVLQHRYTGICFGCIRLAAEACEVVPEDEPAG